MLRGVFMQKVSLRKHLLLGLLMACIMMAVLSSCGRKEHLHAKSEFSRQSLSIDGELQWMPCYNLLYFPLNKSADGDKIGVFKQKNEIREKMQTFKSAFSGTADARNDEITVEVYHDTLSEEDLFALINSHAKELTEKYPDEKVTCRINGSTRIDQFVQLDADREHRLYIRTGESVYILYGRMFNYKWKKFLEDWLFTSGLQWNGSVVMHDNGTVEDAYTYPEYKEEGLWRTFQYGMNCLRIDGDILLFHRQDDGFYFKLESGDTDERLVEEVVLRPADIRLQHDGWESAVSYFTDKYPDMYGLESYLYGEDTLWNSEKKKPDHVFYKVEEPEGSHGFFLWDGGPYEVFSQGKTDYYNMVDTIRNTTGYDYDVCFLWEQEADGGIIYEDNLEGTYFYIKNWENEKSLRLRAEIIDKEKGELIDNITYRVEIFDEKENEFLQEIRAESAYSHKSPFKFEDFNADGYPDLTVEYYYGANGGSASHYIFSPSEKEFIELDSELNYYGMYSVDYETRQLYMHYHGSAISGTETTYQWKNEMDYEMIKQFGHDTQDNHVQVKIVRYENGKEEILSDYLYPMEEYLERFDIWGTYYEDFIWEREVTDRSTGKKYIIRYAEIFLPEEAERNNGIYYDGRIYVYDEDTYLISVTHSEFIAQSSSIEWENGDGEQKQAVIIRYPDSGKSTYYLSVLIKPDYPPAKPLITSE